MPRNRPQIDGEDRMTPDETDPTRHDYEPGEATTPMQTDPLCAVCGNPKGMHR